MLREANINVQQINRALHHVIKGFRFFVFSSHSLFDQFQVKWQTYLFHFVKVPRIYYDRNGIDHGKIQIYSCCAECDTFEWSQRNNMFCLATGVPKKDFNLKRWSCIHHWACEFVWILGWKRKASMIWGTREMRTKQTKKKMWPTTFNRKMTKVQHLQFHLE